ncbi:MAG: DUF805 domain-containing protein [Proteobacteria bacterium]|nr:DUF805 domain-containing protein [Pseudomonadota bacterium]
MEPLNWFMKTLVDHYADFDGRAGRAEFWWSVLMFWVVLFLLVLIGGLLPVFNYIAALFIALTASPFLGLGIRRMHDTGRSGWHALIPGLNILLAAQAGTNGANAYGPDPRAPG